MPNLGRDLEHFLEKASDLASDKVKTPKILSRFGISRKYYYFSRVTRQSNKMLS
ncbi:hypothetical protein XM38_019240 [Halomicronema hongdechloris C2206]|uniref:Uncharacterized protein n=1 Tax=Halomicronema hongdechloris C2206 TaxID=1641165 RepID=A0A1Z3HL16_9CYAN|nr:hypothetical protein XM38_019240 [Halomicronema hongdechloris C2206]